MNLIYLALTLGLIWLNLAGLTLQTWRLLPCFHIARSSAVLCLVLVMFFMEHFHGFGQLAWLWPLTSVVSAYALWKNRKNLGPWGFWRSEILFVTAFFYSFAWRFSFPSISPTSERITDLYFISNYLPGATLPPPDNWYPPHLFGFYYAFEHYAAALMGRLLDLDVGTTYNIAFGLLMAFSITLAWASTRYFIDAVWCRLLLVFTLVIGGTGLSPLLHVVLNSPEVPETNTELAWQNYEYSQATDAFRQMIFSARFIGYEDENLKGSSPEDAKLVETIFPSARSSSNLEPRVLPLENFGYQFFIGDYHPPLGGFFLLLLALALISFMEMKRAVKLSQAILGITIPAMLITNTWTFPLQGLLIIGWIGYRYWSKQRLDWMWLLAGGLLGGLLAFPFLTDFTAGSLGIPIRLVSADDHTPLARFLALHWPLLLLMGLGLSEPRWRCWSVAAAVSFAVMLLVSEFLYIDDPTGGRFVRTNTTMKWWGWIFVGGLVSLGATCLGSSRRWIRWTTVGMLLMLNVYAYDVARFWIFTAKPQMGKIWGHHWYTEDPAIRDMFNYLREASHGIVLENLPTNAYMKDTVYALFNNKPVLLGWPSHLNTWHGEVPRVWQLTLQIRDFYSGRLDQSAQWLIAQNVRYIVFGPSDEANRFSEINRRIKNHYAWFAFNRDGQRHLGIWVRRST